ncbi:serine hydrolase [Actinomadura fibrosa]|uniref:Serine hydrolase n=1 Tax=Actinomadura fibrosa TaxID=111802 RepID=A0ABW2XM27_9ACTN|nr:serine hydrolase [Actinomadura fibrosa]
MRRHFTVLLIAASAVVSTGAGLMAALVMRDGPDTDRTRPAEQADAPRTPHSGDHAADIAAGSRDTAKDTLRRLRFDPARLRRTVQAYLAGRPAKAGVMALDLRTGRAFGHNENARFVIASVMKVDILTGLLLQRQGRHRDLSTEERDLADRMIRESDNTAADALYARSGYGTGIQRANRHLGLRSTTPFTTSWGSSLTSPADQVRLLSALTTSTSPLGAPGRAYVLGLMGSVLHEQAWGISKAALSGERVALKNGWTPVHHQGHGWAVNSIGRITGPDHDFLVAACSAESPTMESGVTTIEQLTTMVVSSMR